MATPYDVGAKKPIDLDPDALLYMLDWPGNDAIAKDSNLPEGNYTADRLLEVSNPDYIVHVEFQSGRDTGLPERMAAYNFLARDRYKKPVKSVVVLLRRKADFPGLTGRWEADDHIFFYSVFRLWTIPPEKLLSGPIAIWPFAVLGKVVKAKVPGVIDAIQNQLRGKVRREMERFIWSEVYLLLGLRFLKPEIERLMKGRYQMLDLRDSSTYMGILEEGRREGRREGRIEGEEKGEAKGEAKGERKSLLAIGRKRFGDPDEHIREMLERIDSVELLDALLDRILLVETWYELLEE